MIIDHQSELIPFIYICMSDEEWNEFGRFVAI